MKAFQFRPIRRVAALAAVAVGASVAGTSVASAGTSMVDFTSSTSMRSLGSFSGTAMFNSDTDLLTVVMTNTSSKGYLYGLAFDVADGDKAKDVSNDGKHGFKGVGKHGVSVKPFGKYEAGAIDSTSNRHSLATGASKTMEFRITGAATGMTAYDLLDNPKGESVVATFRGFKHGKKDHAAGAVVIPVTPSDGDVPTGNADPSSSPGGTIVPITKPGSTGGSSSSGGSSGSGGGGAINLPGTGGQTPMAVPLPSAAASGISMLLVLAGAMGRRKLAGMIA